MVYFVPCARINTTLPISIWLLGGGWRSVIALSSFLIATLTDGFLHYSYSTKWYRGDVAGWGGELLNRCPALIILHCAILRRFCINQPTQLPGYLLISLVLFVSIVAFAYLTGNMYYIRQARNLLFTIDGLFSWGQKKGGRPSAQRGKSSQYTPFMSGGVGAAPEGGSFTPGSSPVPKMMDPIPVPKGASLMVATILEATNHYDVLGVSELARDEEIRKLKRTSSLATHPDKVGAAPGAASACQRVLEAAEVLLDSETRAQYDDEISQARFISSGMRDQHLEEMLDSLYEATGIDYSNTDSVLLACDCCARGVHQVPLVPDRTQAAARWCKKCGVYHPAEEGEHWVESSIAWSGLIPGSRLNMYIALRGKVYDASVLGECQGVLQMWARNGMPTNTHTNLMNAGRGGGGGGGGSGSGQRQTAGKKERKKGRKGRR